MANPTRTRRPPATTPGRIPRPGATARSRPTARRTAAAQRRGVAGGWLQRGRPQQQSGFKRALSGATGALPGLGKGSPAPGGKGKRGKAGGLALLAGAAGLAFKNRDKVTALLQRKRSSGDEPPSPGTSPAMDTGTREPTRP